MGAGHELMTMMAYLATTFALVSSFKVMTDEDFVSRLNFFDTWAAIDSRPSPSPSPSPLPSALPAPNDAFTSATTMASKLLSSGWDATLWNGTDEGVGALESLRGVQGLGLDTSV
jgi:hypothetical protein